MSSIARNFGRQPSMVVRACLLSLVMLSSTLINVVAEQPSSWTPENPTEWNQSIDFNPTLNQSHVNTTESSMIKVPANHTFTSSNLELSPIWQATGGGGLIYDSNYPGSFNASYNQTQVSSIDGQLRLQRNSSVADLTDFESTSTVPSDGWFGNGYDDEVWTIISPSNTPLQTQSAMNLPTEGYNASGFLSTSGLGDLDSMMFSCLRSPNLNMPRIINNYSLFFDQWLALDSSDFAWVVILDKFGNWHALNANQPWSGQSNSWNRIELKLDQFVSPLQPTLNIQFCFQTSNVSMPRGGWFIDEVSIYNEGEALGAWLHGNLSGDYLPNLNSKFTIPLDFTLIPNVDEIEISMNWDIQGYIYDYLSVEYSIDNGSSWNTITGNYGIPGIGVWHNGNLYYAESNGWVPIFLSLNYNFINSPALNNTMLRFSGFTDSSVNFGGTSSSGWEGIAIDNIVFHSGRQTNNPSSCLLYTSPSPRDS